MIAPDLVILRPEICRNVPRDSLKNDTHRILGLEVKKLERQPSGTIARASGLDYNTTPPCGTIRVYDKQGEPLDIRGFYVFVCQEPVEGKRGHYALSAMALCDGNLLNADFHYYLSIVGERQKEIGLGTYGDGMNRVRPMLIFANPLGVSALDGHVTLVHSNVDLESQYSELRRVGVIHRTAKEGASRTFHCYRHRDDASEGHPSFDLKDPFPVPTERTTVTQPRGQFKLNLAFRD